MRTRIVDVTIAVLLFYVCTFILLAYTDPEKLYIVAENPLKTFPIMFDKIVNLIS